jgi:hypothetical protein
LRSQKFCHGDHPACEYKTVRLWDLSSKILRLKRRPQEHWRGFKPGFHVATQCKSLLQAFAAGAGGRHDSKGGTCEAERLTPKSNEYQIRLQAAARPSRADPDEAHGARDRGGALELLQLPLEAVLAGILPLIGITGDIAFDGAEAVVGPVIIATMLLPYLVPPPLLRQIGAHLCSFLYFRSFPRSSSQLRATCACPQYRAHPKTTKRLKRECTSASPLELANASGKRQFDGFQ